MECERLNKLLKLKEVSHFLRYQKLDIVGLLETRIQAQNGNKLFRVMSPNWRWLQNCDYNRKGRIYAGWKLEVVGVIHSIIGEQFVHCSVKCKNSNECFSIPFVYGLNTIGERKNLWVELADLCSSVQGPWLLMGDFNSVYCPN